MSLESAEDMFRDQPGEIDDVQWLASKGFQPFVSIGNDTWMSIRTYRSHDRGDERYVIAVGDPRSSPSYVTADGLPTLMDTLARWAPAVQAATSDDMRGAAQKSERHRGQPEGQQRAKDRQGRRRLSIVELVTAAGDDGVRGATIHGHLRSWGAGKNDVEADLAYLMRRDTLRKAGAFTNYVLGPTPYTYP